MQRRTQGDATVLVICTRGRQDASLKLEDLQREFPQLRFRGLHVVDSVKGTGIHELRQKLVEIVREDGGRTNRLFNDAFGFQAVADF